MASASQSLFLAPILGERVQRYIGLNRVAGLGLMRDQGPESLTDEPRYSTGDYVVEISITEVKATTPGSAKLPYRFTVSARGRLIRVADNVVVDAFSKEVRTNDRTVNQWTANGNSLLSAELGAVFEQVAQSFVDEWVLIYRGAPIEKIEAAPLQAQGPFPGGGSQLQTEPAEVLKEIHAPDYVLRPMDPPVSASLRFRQPLFPGHLTPANVGSVTPTLAWESLPRTLQAELFAGPAPRARNLVYEVRILDGELQGTAIFRAARVVRSYNNLVEPKVEVAQRLYPCQHYFWTVRARFELDGRQRATEWSGAYIKTYVGEVDPSWFRRPTGSMFRMSIFPMSGYFFPFKTPASDGKECSDGGVR
jgi:hypothetical protein